MSASSIDRLYPAEDLMVPTPLNVNARTRILTLAERSGVRFQTTPEDELAKVITRLSDDSVETDDVEDSAVALKRSGVITGNELVDLLGQYLSENVMRHVLERAVPKCAPQTTDRRIT